jgi:hypothetical protein
MALADFRCSSQAGHWNLEWIELSRTDVTNLCRAGSRETALKNRTRPALERAQQVINQLYPDGVPEQAVVPNVVLYRQVGEKLKANGLQGVGNDTILRASGRRK